MDEVVGSNPTRAFCGPVAQLVRARKHRVRLFLQFVMRQQIGGSAVRLVIDEATSLVRFQSSPLPVGMVLGW
jgi:hypothetical protein